MSNSRTDNAIKNILYGYIGTILTTVMSFIVRTVFIYGIGTTFLGISGLFSNILGMLSFTELGIGTAMNFSLYKPIAENDIEKVKSLMKLYKSAYRLIAIVILIIGLSILPFLTFFVKGAENIESLRLYYLIFLFNSVSSYFITYKYGLINAEQKGYVLTNINTFFTIIMNIIQIIFILAFKNYLLYLLTQAIIQLVQKVYTNIYINKFHPYLNDKNIHEIPLMEKKNIYKNVKALMVHKLGEISVYQTDNIITSAFINVKLVGLVSNYSLVVQTINTFTNIILNGVSSSLGNLIALENKNRQLEIFNIYRFCGFWINCILSVCLVTLFQPFIRIWIGTENIIEYSVVLLLILNNYLMIERLLINNLKTSAGIFQQDQYIALLQGIMNIIISVILAKNLGLVGIYLGTVLSGLIPTLLRPYIVYKNMFSLKIKSYYKDFLLYLIFTFSFCLIYYTLLDKFLISANLVVWILIGFIEFLTLNIILYLIFKKNNKFIYIKNIIFNKLHNNIKERKIK